MQNGLPVALSAQAALEERLETIAETVAEATQSEASLEDAIKTLGPPA